MDDLLFTKDALRKEFCSISEALRKRYGGNETGRS